MADSSDSLPLKDSITVVVAHRSASDRGLELSIEMGGKHGTMELIQGMSRADTVASLRALADQIEREEMNAHGHGPLANQVIVDELRKRIPEHPGRTLQITREDFRPGI